jgi:hypothetical protein
METMTLLNKKELHDTVMRWLASFLKEEQAQHIYLDYATFRLTHTKLRRAKWGSREEKQPGRQKQSHGPLETLHAKREVLSRSCSANSFIHSSNKCPHHVLTLYQALS